MSDKNIEKRHHSTFEQIKEQEDDGKEFWTARKLSKVLDLYENTPNKLFYKDIH